MMKMMYRMTFSICRHAPAARAVPRAVGQPDPAVLARLPRQVPAPAAAAADQAAARPPRHRQPQEGAAAGENTASVHPTGFTLLLGVTSVAKPGVRGHVWVSSFHLDNVPSL